jgi:hypothetical protein
MKINYKYAESNPIEVEVFEEIGELYEQSIRVERLNDRMETRRHTSYSTFEHGRARG